MVGPKRRRSDAWQSRFMSDWRLGGAWRTSTLLSSELLNSDKRPYTRDLQQAAGTG
jgi:hypothetical protein